MIQLAERKQKLPSQAVLHMWILYISQKIILCLCKHSFMETDEFLKEIIKKKKRKKKRKEKKKREEEKEITN